MPGPLPRKPATTDHCPSSRAAAPPSTMKPLAALSAASTTSDRCHTPAPCGGGSSASAAALARNSKTPKAEAMNSACTRSQLPMASPFA